MAARRPRCLQELASPLRPGTAGSHTATGLSEGGPGSSRGTGSLSRETRGTATDLWVPQLPSLPAGLPRLQRNHRAQNSSPTTDNLQIYSFCFKIIKG